MKHFRIPSTLACIAATYILITPSRADTPAEWIAAHLDEHVQLYQEFHQHPELSFFEVETAKKLANVLTDAGYAVTTDIGGHGVVAILENGDGPTVMWRCDLDALPVPENTGLPFASTAKALNEAGVEVPVMHACGHDIHITNLVATARYLAAHRDQWAGRLMFIGQPAEERGGGAEKMLDDGLFTKFPKPDFALALHVDATLPTGKIGYRAGYALANVDNCDITVKGRGGHGSFPHGCIDPIVEAAELIMSLQTIVARENSPNEPAVVTVGSIHGGTKHNIIPDECKLQLTIRSYDPEVRKKLQAAIERRARAIAAAYGAPEPEVKFSEGTPAVFNNVDLVERTLPALADAIGQDNLTESERSMGGEDFSRYGLAGVPIFMFRLGSVAPSRMDEYAQQGLTPPSLHSAEYYPEPRETLRTGLVASVSAIVGLMPPASGAPSKP